MSFLNIMTINNTVQVVPDFLLPFAFWVAPLYTVIRFVPVSTKFGTCTVVSENGTLVKAKMCTFTLECKYFIFNKCPIFIHVSSSAKSSTS